ncbi:MAG: hypothetical protein WCQ32_03195 [bacterium]
MNIVSIWLKNHRRRARINYFKKTRFILINLKNAKEKAEKNARMAALSLTLKDLGSFGTDKIRKKILLIIDRELKTQ